MAVDPAWPETPPRRPYSIRRTTVHLVTRPAGLDGPAVLAASGRDLLSDGDGEGTVLAELRIDAAADYLGGTLLTLAQTPPDPRLDALAGAGFFAGFRGAVLRALPQEAAAPTLRYQLLDDLPVAIMANGRSLRAEGRAVTRRTQREPPINLCAGYGEGSTALAGFSDLGPPLTVGPDATDLGRTDDPVAWHDWGAVSAHATCRMRRIDVWREGGRAFADTFLRDSHCDRDVGHRLVHQWSLSAEFDAASGTILAISAEAGHLPYPECPGTAASAARLIGLPAAQLRQHVRAHFTGASICSHLNDSYRALADLGALLATLNRAGDLAAKASIPW